MKMISGKNLILAHSILPTMLTTTDCILLCDFESKWKKRFSKRRCTQNNDFFTVQNCEVVGGSGRRRQRFGTTSPMEKVLCMRNYEWCARCIRNSGRMRTGQKVRLNWLFFPTQRCCNDDHPLSQRAIQAWQPQELTRGRAATSLEALFRDKKMIYVWSCCCFRQTDSSLPSFTIRDCFPWKRNACGCCYET